MAEDSSAVAFTLTEEDYVSFCRFHATESPLRRRRVLWAQRGFFLLFPVAAGIFVGLDEGFWQQYGPSGSLSLIAVTVVAGLFMAGIHPSMARAIIGRQMRRRLRDGTFASVLRPARVELLPDGLKWSSSAGNSLTRWSSFVDVVSDGKAAYAYLSSMQAYIIPRRAFADAASFERFVAELRQRRHAAVAENEGR